MFRLFFLSLGPMCAVLAYITVLRPLRLRLRVRYAMALVLLAWSLKFTWFHFFGGNIFHPEMPAVCLHVMSVLHDFTVALAGAGVLVASVRFVLALCIKKKGGPDMTRRRMMAGSLAFVAAGFAGKGVYDGVRLPDIVEVPLEFPDLPAEFDGYRIAQISDLHVSAAARKKRTEGVVRLVNSCSPDLIVTTGDLMDGDVELRGEDVAPLAELRAPDGVIGCTGNHEYYSKWDKWSGFIRSLGIRILENERILIRRGDAALAVFGRNDQVSRDTDIAAASALTPEKAFRILLVHRPTRLAEHASYGMRLQLSGHTHGGAALGLDRIVARSNEGHVRGVYREHGMVLYVNSGTGQWGGFPTRIGIMPEITLITLRKGRARVSGG